MPACSQGIGGSFIHVCVGPPQIFPKKPTCAKDKWKLEQQLKRLDVRIEASRGEVMNMEWLGWMDQYMSVLNALEVEGD